MIKLNDMNDSVDFQTIHRILVIKLQHLGDTLLTTPLYSVIKQQFPNIIIDVLVYKETLSVLDGNPHINISYSIDREWKTQGKILQLRREYQLVKQLKTNQYDLIINLTDRWRGSWLTRILNPKYSVSQAYAHRRGKIWYKSFSHIYAVPAVNRHTVETNLDAIRRLGIDLQSVNKKLILKIKALSAQKIKNLLAEQPLINSKIIVIHPTSRWMFKAWSSNSFSRVIDLLSEDGFFVVLISGPKMDEINYAQSILATTHNTVMDLTGQLSINESAALIKIADCFIGLDSVAMHISAAVSTPCVVLFGPTKDKVWHPWQVSHQVVTENFACRPCDLKGCGNGMKSECIQAIQPEKVVQAVKDLMDEKKNRLD